MDIDQWRSKYSDDAGKLTIEQVIQFHIEELDREVEYFDKKEQTHGHQDIWLKFLRDILEGKNPKRKDWSNWG